MPGCLFCCCRAACQLHMPAFRYGVKHAYKADSWLHSNDEGNPALLHDPIHVLQIC